MVPAVARMGPWNPSLTTCGIRPQWSRCAWVSRIASSVVGSYASGIRFRTDSFGPPWNIPQSTRMRAWPVSRRNWLPVTVVAAPRKWRSMARMVPPPGAEDRPRAGLRAAMSPVPLPSTLPAACSWPPASAAAAAGRVPCSTRDRDVRRRPGPVGAPGSSISRTNATESVPIGPPAYPQGAARTPGRAIAAGLCVQRTAGSHRCAGRTHQTPAARAPAPPSARLRTTAPGGPGGPYANGKRTSASIATARKSSVR